MSTLLDQEAGVRMSGSDSEHAFESKGGDLTREALLQLEGSFSNLPIAVSTINGPLSVANVKSCQPNSIPNLSTAVSTINSSCSVVDEEDEIPSPAPDKENKTSRIVGQLETRPISLDQLISSVEGIYAAVVMVEAICCEVDAKQAATAPNFDGKRPRLKGTEWQGLIDLHRLLLYEYHDLFLVLQHPGASDSLRKLALEYHMPARMWCQGIYNFLELLRHHLPYSLEYMLTFIYLAYNIMGTLYITIPALKDAWVECLGDLSLYRMVISDQDEDREDKDGGDEDGDGEESEGGDEDDCDRDIWANVARFWYSEAANKTPDVGRLYHHFAILARPNTLQQLFYYCKSLCVSQPFSPTRQSILTLFNSIFAADCISVDSKFIQLHGINFTHTDLEKFDGALGDYLNTLRCHISDPESNWKVLGGYVVVCNITGLYQYDVKNSPLHQTAVTIEEKAHDNTASILPPLPDGASYEHTAPLLQTLSDLVKAASGADQRSSNGEISLNYSKRLAYSVLEVVLEMIGNANVLPHVHIWLAFMMHITASEQATPLLENEFPWRPLVTMLKNSQLWRRALADLCQKTTHCVGFAGSSAFQEDGSRMCRVERILWLAIRIAASDTHLVFHDRSFSVHPSLLQRIDIASEGYVLVNVPSRASEHSMPS